VSEEHDTTHRLVEVTTMALYVSIALLAALAAVQALAIGDDLVVDARLAGVAVAAVALVLRAPFIVVVAAAALTAALLRLATG
jgi:hypothetical protein